MIGPAFSFALALLAGFLFGLAYFVSLRLSVRALTGPRKRWRAFAASGVMRFAALLAVLAALLWLETGPVLILAGLPGFLGARIAVTAYKAGER